MKHNHLISVLVVTAVLLFVPTRVSAQWAVFDQMNSILSKFISSERAAEFEESIRQAYLTLEQANQTYNSIKGTEETWKAVTGLGNVVKYSNEIQRAASQTSNIINNAQATYNNIRYMVADGYISPQYAGYLLRELFEVTRRAANQYKFFSNILLGNDEKMDAATRLGEIRRMNDSLGIYNMFIEYMMKGIVKQARSQAVAKNRKALGQKAFLGSGAMPDDSVFTNLSSRFSYAHDENFSGVSVSGGGAASIKVPSKQEFIDEFSQYFEEEKLKSEAESFASGTIAPLRSPITRLVEAIIGLMAVLYLALNYYKVSKGEQQSQDALLKVLVGVLFAAIAIAVLEMTFGGNLGLNL